MRYKNLLVLLITFHWIAIKACNKFSKPLTIFFNLDFPFLARYRVLSLISLGIPEQECSGDP